MIATVGFLFLFLALSFSFFQTCLYLASYLPQTSFGKLNIFIKQDLQPKLQQNFTFLTSASCILAMLALIYCFVISDFSVSNVYFNSHHLKPLIYKITGSWGNHEGSILLLVTILTLYSTAFAILSKIDQNNKALVLAIQAFITFGILSFIVITSNPFLRINPVPESGIGLNPILQDIGLAAHPPMLYTGYIGFSLIFSLAVTALIREKIDQDFAKFTQPWLSFAFSFLTLGIGLGSWWAYRELGWGGYWFWDPVENVSLMPWLCCVALLHSLAILKKTGNFKIWTTFLAILTFIFCLLGIFLVRSGILTSVHSFASDPNRGIFIILLFVIIGGFGFAIFFFKALKITTKNRQFDLISRSGFILINNFIFCLSLFVVVLGTLYPIILQLFFDSSISVGAPYYAKILAPITLITLSLMIFVPILKLEKFHKINKKQFKKLILSTLLCLLFLWPLKNAENFSFTSLVLTFLALITLLFSIFNLEKITFNNKIKLKEAINKYIIFLAHNGFALIILAICLNALFAKNLQLNMSFGQEEKLKNYVIKFDNVEHSYGKNYLTRIGIFKISYDQKEFYLKPESRYYPVADQNTTEAAIKNNLFSDFYIVLGEKNREDNFVVRIYDKPFISIIWLGCVMIFLGGILRIIPFLKWTKTN